MRSLYNKVPELVSIFIFSKSFFLQRLIREEMSSLSAEQKKLIQEQTLTLKKATSQHNEGNRIPSGGEHEIMKNRIQHLCAELIQKSTTAAVVNPKKWLPLLPSYEGMYPTVDWGALDGSQGNAAFLWKEMTVDRPGGPRKLPVPQLLLEPSVCRDVRLTALDLNLERKDSSLSLLGVPVGDQIGRSGSVHMKVRLSLPTSNGKYQKLCRESLVILEPDCESKLIQFGDVSWNLMDRGRLPQLSLTLLPVDPLDKEWWCHGMSPVRPNRTGMYPTVDCNSLGGDQDCMQVWKHIITTKKNTLSLTASNSLCLPPMYLPGLSGRVVNMYMTRHQPNYIGLYIFYHDKLRRNNPSMGNTFNIKIEMTLRLRSLFWTEKQLNKSQTVTVYAGSGSGCVLFEVENFIALDPDVLPVLNVAITDVK